MLVYDIGPCRVALRQLDQLEITGFLQAFNKQWRSSSERNLTRPGVACLGTLFNIAGFLKPLGQWKRTMR